jgi:hypothetical protein
MSRREHGPDDWLGLVPEVERLAPGLVAGMEGPSAGAATRARIEVLIRRGDATGWLAFLGDLTERVMDADVRTDEGRMLLAEILRDQYRLAPGVLDLAAHDEEASALLERVTCR